MLAVILVPAFLPACMQKQAAKDWVSILAPVKSKFAPDPRLAVFHVDVRTEGGGIVVSGEVEDPAARTELLAALRNAGVGEVSDQIRVLPDPVLEPKTIGLINVSVGNVRREPDHPAELVSQVLLGDTVRLLKKDRGWYYIHCADRYLGWIDEEVVVPVDETAARGWSSSDLYRVVSRSGLVRTKPEPNAEPLCDVIAGGLLRRVGGMGGWIQVSLPDGRNGFVDGPAVMSEPKWRESAKLSPENIETTARSFMGVPYLWGGTSARGFDCSGFVKTVFFLNGKQLMRDANQQAREGEDVAAGDSFRELRRGDLLFFGRRATAEQPERITHVGIYLSEGKFIHCSGRVRISSLDPSAPDYDEGHVKRFVRARRLVQP